MSELHVSTSLNVPRSFAGRSAFVAGTKGSGKTYTTGVIAEELLAAGLHVLMLDPTGVMWGLRSGSDGGPGGYPVIILGGPHGDVPLQPTAGVAVADFIIKSGQSCILDMSGFHSDAEQDRFVEALLSRLYRSKAESRENLHIIMDEADMFIPQNPMRGQEHLIHAAKTIVTKGRSRGLGMTMVTQRPQSISKAVIEEADVIFCHRMQGLRAVKAMQAWTDLYADKDQAKEFFDSLPKLADGECWVWSPKFLDKFERVKIRRKRTFDSSRTPEPGERTRKPKATAAVDLAALTAEIQAAADEAKANDPKTLKAEIARLKKELESRPAVKPERVEIPLLKPDEKELIDLWRAKTQQFIDELPAIGEALGKILYRKDSAHSPTAMPKAVREFGEQFERMGRRSEGVTAKATERIKMSEDRDGTAKITFTVGEQKLPVGEKATLIACAQSTDGCDRSQLTVLTGYKRSSRDTYISRLKEKGFVETSFDGLVRATEAGIEALGDDYEPLPTGAALRKYWMDRLPDGECKVLECLITAGPGPGLSREEITAMTGYKRSSRDTYISRMKAKKLIETNGMKIVASTHLFN